MISNEQMKKAGYFGGIGLGIIIVTAFIFSQIIFPILLGRTPKVETPDVVGMGLLQAKKILQAEKLHVVVKDSLFSETEAVEAIIEQHPEPGEKIRQDGTVYLIISKGSSTVAVPSLVGRPFQEVIISLRNLGLHALVVDSTYSDIYAVNSVIRSVPGTGSKVNKSSTVKLILSKGSYPMADSLGMELPDTPY